MVKNNPYSFKEGTLSRFVFPNENINVRIKRNINELEFLETLNMNRLNIAPLFLISVHCYCLSRIGAQQRCLRYFGSSRMVLSTSYLTF